MKTREDVLLFQLFKREKMTYLEGEIKICLVGMKFITKVKPAGVSMSSCAYLGFLLVFWPPGAVELLNDC